MEVRAEGEAAMAELEGPLNALEAERYCEHLRTFRFEDMGGTQWMRQHEWLTQLNMKVWEDTKSGSRCDI